jgi:hypothetical protein
MKMLEECEFSVGPLPSLNLVLGVEKYQPSDLRVDRSPPYILEREENSGLRGSKDVVDLYKNDGGSEGPIFTKTRRYSLQPTTTSSSGDDDPGHDHAMSYGMREVKLRGCHMAKGMAIGQRRPNWKGYKFQTRARI